MIDHAREHAEHEFGAQYDDARERYASELEDLRHDDLQSEWYMQYMTKVYEAGFYDDYEAYEDAWTRTLNYYENQGV